jgi:hypothetical protein
MRSPGDFDCRCMGRDHRTPCTTYWRTVEVPRPATQEDGLCDDCRLTGCEFIPLPPEKVPSD